MGYRILFLAGAMAIGYWIMIKASKEKDIVKTAGQVLAWAIMVITLLIFLFSGYFSISRSCKSMFRSHRRGKGKGHYRSYRRHSEKEEDLLYKGIELYRKKEYKKAIEIWEKVLKLDPDNKKAERYIKRSEYQLQHGKK